MRKLALIGMTALLVAGGACRKPAKLILTKDQRARIQENILPEAPAVKTPLNANFGDNIRLIGVDLSQDRVKPGETITVTYYWECLRETPGEWKVFVHLELPAGKRMILDHHPVGELYPIGNWKKGEIIRDVQRFTVASDTRPGPAVLWAGLFNEAIYREQGGGDRMELKNKDQVPNDGDNRVRVAQFTVVGAEGAARSQAAVLVARRVAGPIAVDGKLDEAVWASRDEAVALRSAEGAAVDAALATTVMAAYDDKTLYLAFDVKDKAIESPYKNRDDELWNADAVEVYLDPGADGKDYLEIQVSPANVVFDALFSSHRTPDWKEARSHNLKGLRTAVAVSGTMNQSGDEDTGYTVELAIPFEDLPGQTAPAVGATLRANFFRIEASGGQVTGSQAFSPAGGDFHDLSRAGLIRFAGEKQAQSPAAPAAVPSPMLKAPPTRIPSAVRPRVLQPAETLKTPAAAPGGQKP